MITRKEFCWSLAAAAVTPALAAEPEQHFIITSDIHAVKNSVRLSDHVAEWNAMQPRPAFVASLGDLGYVNSSFGDRPRDLKNGRESFAFIKEHLVEALDKAIPLVMVVGNHDTYLGEKDMALWREYFPAQPPRCTFKKCGINFITWNAGVDGTIDVEQQAWIQREVDKIGPSAPLVIMVHQPAVGSMGMERDIGRMAKEVLRNRTAPVWMLCGHVHCNTQSKWQLAHTELYVVAHTMDRHGYWDYTVRGGQIVARTFHDDAKHTTSAGVMPATLKSNGEIPTPFWKTPGVLRKWFVGSPEEIACRTNIYRTPDNGAWFFYLDKTEHALPMVPGARELVVLGNFWGQRKTKEPEKFLFSGDGQTWQEVPRPPRLEGGEYRFAIPEALRNAKTLHFRIEAFRYGCDDCLAAFALKK